MKRNRGIWSVMGRLVIALLVILTWGILPAPVTHAQEASGTVGLFETVSGTLDAENPQQDWVYEARAGEVIAVIVTGTGGDLDPTLMILGPDGETLAENDDLDSLVTDAGAEGVLVEEAGTVILRVGRYQRTSGTYDLSVSRGYAKVARDEDFSVDSTPWVNVQGDVASLVAGAIQLRMNPIGATGITYPSDGEPLGDFYYEARFAQNVASTFAAFGLVFRAQPGGENYQFRVTTEGRWNVVMEDRAGSYVMGAWTAEDAPASGEWTLGVWARGELFSFYGNGVLLGSVRDDRLPVTGRIGLMIATSEDQVGPAIVDVDDILVTTRLGTTYRGMPLALQTWNSLNPERIAGELVDAGQVTLQGARDLFVAESTVEADDQSSVIQLLGSEQAVYTDFLLGVSVVVLTDGETTACGVVSHWEADNTFDVAYVDVTGGFGVSQLRADDLVTNVYDETDMIAPESANTLLLVAQGERLALYVNGALVTEETVQPGEGRVGLALLNYEDATTECVFGNVWVWPLESTGS